MCLRGARHGTTGAPLSLGCCPVANDRVNELGGVGSVCMSVGWVAGREGERSRKGQWRSQIKKQREERKEKIQQPTGRFQARHPQEFVPS